VRRTVPVRPRIGGDSEILARIENTVAEPPSVEVEALPEEFSRLKVLTTEEVVPETPEGVFTARVRVNLPEGHAKIVGNPTVLVRIQFRK
jgi:hypothetical protein